MPRGDCRFLEQNDTRLKEYVEIGVDAEACVFLPDPGDGGYAGSWTRADTGTVLLSRPCQRDGSLGTPATPPHLKCTIDLMEELHCEMSSVYRLRARTIEKLPEKKLIAIEG